MAKPSLAQSLRTLPEVGAHFQALRCQVGKTQTEVAAAVGMRQEALSRFESGAGMDFSLGKLLKLLQVLELELSFRPVVRHPTLDEVLAEQRSGVNTGPASR